jgi:hypothetical protein
VPSYSDLRGFELTVTPRDKRLSLACPRAGVHVQLTTICDCRFSIGETKWGHEHCAKNSQDRCATDIQTIKELAVPGTSIQWAYIPRAGFIESLQQLDLEPTDAREYFVKERK